MLSLGFYFHMTATHFLQTKRKDFYQLLMHHVATILLISLSFTCNFIRIGTVVILIHDIIDPIGHATKLAVYLKMRRTSDILFVMVLLAWYSTRCIIYPLYPVHTTLFYAPTVIKLDAANISYWVFNALLISLVFLHYWWGYLLAKAVIRFVLKGEVQDERSSDDELYEKEQKELQDVLQEDQENTPNGIQNNNLPAKSLHNEKTPNAIKQTESHDKTL